MANKRRSGSSIAARSAKAFLGLLDASASKDGRKAGESGFVSLAAVDLAVGRGLREVADRGGRSELGVPPPLTGVGGFLRKITAAAVTRNPAARADCFAKVSFTDVADHLLAGFKRKTTGKPSPPGWVEAFVDR